MSTFVLELHGYRGLVGQIEVKEGRIQVRPDDDWYYATIEPEDAAKLARAVLTQQGVALVDVPLSGHAVVDRIIVQGIPVDVTLRPKCAECVERDEDGCCVECGECVEGLRLR